MAKFKKLCGNRYTLSDCGSYYIGETTGKDEGKITSFYYIDTTTYDRIKNDRFCITENGYIVKSHFGRIVKLHSLIVGQEDGKIVDHINGNKLDNRVCNLRFVTRAENSYNSKRTGSTGYRGVTRTSNNRYIVHATINKRCKYLGMFKTPEEAAMKYICYMEENGLDKYLRR